MFGYALYIWLLCIVYHLPTPIYDTRDLLPDNWL